jgi:hypothetical protein
MADIAVITCITDGYDTLKPVLPQTGADVEWVCVTDGKTMPDAEAARGWNMICEPGRLGAHPNLRAKRPKCLPWEYTDAPASVWIDGSYRVVSEHFAVEAVALADPIAQFVHPWRDCVYDEAAHSLTLPKYAGQPIGAQQNAYARAYSHPGHWGLWATGCIARRHTSAVRAMGMEWLEEIRAWSWQDQISQPVVLRANGLRPTALPGDHLTNPWLHYEGSARHG